MSAALTLWIVGDGKPGHENQSLGLAEAISRRIPCQIHLISIAGKKNPLTRVRAALQASTALPKADFIIGAGHATHVTLLWLARKYGVRSIVLMRPSLPLAWFDLCIAPTHDFPDGSLRANLILTQGALNRVSPPTQVERKGGFILIGGPSRSHGWDEVEVTGQVAELTKTGNYSIADSRRTPSGFMGLLAKEMPGVEFFPHQTTAPDWLPKTLASAEEIWVTEDSVSMIYEALSSGARVGLLSLPRLGENTRVLRGLEQLIVAGYLTPFANWQKTHKLSAALPPLREADRCADYITKQFS